MAKHFLHEVVHQLSILESLLQVPVDLLRFFNGWPDSCHLNFFVLFVVLLCLFILASIIIPKLVSRQTHTFRLLLNLRAFGPFSIGFSDFSSSFFLVLLLSHLILGFYTLIVNPLVVNETESLLRLEWLLFKPLINRLTLSHKINNNLNELAKIFSKTSADQNLIQF